MGQGVEKDSYELRFTGLGVCRKLLATCDLRLTVVEVMRHIPLRVMSSRCWPLTTCDLRPRA